MHLTRNLYLEHVKNSQNPTIKKQLQLENWQKKKKKGKWAKYIIHLTRKDVQMANTPTERCSTLLSIREMASSHDHHTPVRSAKIENSDNTECSGGTEGLDPSCTAGDDERTMVQPP